jgi:hypothetical protein
LFNEVTSTDNRGNLPSLTGDSFNVGQFHVCGPWGFEVCGERNYGDNGGEGEKGFHDGSFGVISGNVKFAETSTT